MAWAAHQASTWESLPPRQPSGGEGAGRRRSFEALPGLRSVSPPCEVQPAQGPPDEGWAPDLLRSSQVQPDAQPASGTLGSKAAAAATATAAAAAAAAAVTAIETRAIETEAAAAAAAAAATAAIEAAAAAAATDLGDSLGLQRGQLTLAAAPLPGTLLSSPCCVAPAAPSLTPSTCPPTPGTSPNPSAATSLPSPSPHLPPLLSPSLDPTALAASPLPPCDCAVCAEDLEPGCPACALPCGHVFHAACIRCWLLAAQPAWTAATCPLCRARLWPQPGMMSAVCQPGEGARAAQSRHLQRARRRAGQRGSGAAGRGQASSLGTYIRGRGSENGAQPQLSRTGS
ncbi:hypothetical protein V8C86DRAFT_271675 [Haematococcus lacustris]